MDRMDTDDLDQLRMSVRAALASSSPDDALAELGFTDMIAAYPSDAAAVVFRELGRTNLESAALADVLDTAVPEWGTVGELDRDAVSAGRFAIGHQLLGAAEAMLALAVDHATVRQQFGQPIGAFQAVQHKLADVLVATEAADAALEAAPDAWSALSVDLARVLAGRAARLAAKNCQQVLAGIGFTKEHDFHRYLHQTMQLDGVLGSTSAITKALGAQCLQSRQIPTLVDL